MKRLFIILAAAIVAAGAMAEDRLDPIFDSILTQEEEQVGTDDYYEQLLKAYGAENNEQFQKLQRQSDEYLERSAAEKARQTSNRWLTFALSLFMALLPSFVILKRVITGEIKPANATAVWRTIGTLLGSGIVLFGLNYAWLWCMFTGQTKIMGLVLGLLLFAFVIYAIHTITDNRSLAFSGCTSDDATYAICVAVWF